MHTYSKRLLHDIFNIDPGINLGISEAGGNKRKNDWIMVPKNLYAINKNELYS
jgi:hypothetical protein